MTSLFEILATTNWKILADIAQIVGGVIAIIALLYASKEYFLHKKTNKYDTYSKMNERYCNDKAIQKVLNCMLNSYEGEVLDIGKFKYVSMVKNLSVNDKEMFLRFFEELSYAVEKKSIKKEEACYFFGYYAIVAYLMGNDFVSDLTDKGMWSGFKELAIDMKEIAEYNGYYHLVREENIIKNKKEK